ncbi:hypothetical protein B296_00050566 [Ensete ventricosum]|uniref:Uncharacterized protein n=1 Tax=Ensete ventricosum TaxID=4639 RepID=A0A426X0R2_ENSVE|nr:hypothetical protein B296_00050566 [Ensete ventricosum]
MQGWPTMARVFAGAADCGLGPRMGRRLQGWPHARGSQPPTTKAAASRRGRPRAWLAPPLGTVLARKGGNCGHNARRSCCPRGSDIYHKGGM